MPRIDLLEPLLAGGVRHPHFFNGRVLTAEALQEEQAALHRHTDRLGRAVGEGVAFGLTVAAGTVVAGAPTVDVTPGLAVNRPGQTLAISDETGTVSVALTRTPPRRDLPEGTGLFEACRPGERSGRGDFQPKLDPGAYILAIGPLSAFEARVPGIGGDGVARFCGSRYETEGVYLRLAPLDLDADVAKLVGERVRSSRTEDRVMARNVLAHHCLGTPDLSALRASPRTEGARYGLVDAMREAGDLDDCEVPLALLFWDASALRFVDGWAVRRRLAPAAPAPDWWMHAADRRRVEAEAAWLQFQDQVEAVRASGGFRLRATEAFRYLPSAGYVPAASEALFVEGLTVRNRLRADPAFLRALLHDSFFADPIDLQADPRPAVDLYEVPGSGLVLFVRAAAVAEATRPAEPKAGTGRLSVLVVLPTAQQVGLGLFGQEALPIRRASGSVNTLASEIERRIRVEAIDRQTGAVYPGTLHTKRLPPRSDDPFGIVRRAVEVLPYRFDPLPAGTYLVQLSGVGLQTQSTQRALEAEETVEVTFTLRSSKGPATPPRKPPTRIPGAQIGPGWYKDVRINEGLVDRYARWPWPAEGVTGYERVDLPDDVRDALGLWGGVVRERHPEAPVMPGDVQVFLDAGYTPDGTPPDAPYAYAVYGDGDGGAYVPLVLTTATRSLALPVGVDKSGLFGGDAGIERRLGEVGAAEVDVLANAWGGLVQDATGVGAEAARGVVAGARVAVEGLQNDLRQFTGVTPTLAAALHQAGLETPADLANASAGDLLGALGGDAGGASAAWATLLIGEARASVPAAAWSLDRSGIDGGLREALEHSGVRSLGDLERHAGDDTRIAAVAEAAGLTVETVRTKAAEAAETRVRSASRLDAERTAAGPVSGVEGVGTVAALTLARAGLASTGSLSGANPALVARTLGIGESAARDLVASARTRLGRH